MKNDQTPSSESPSQPCCVFTARLAVTDGGDPIDLIEDLAEKDYDPAQVWRGDEIVGSGNDLLSAWDDYLYDCGAEMTAPVNDEELAEMWAKYDSHNKLL